jgi:hypothetical protein
MLYAVRAMHYALCTVLCDLCAAMLRPVNCKLQASIQADVQYCT